MAIKTLRVFAEYTSTGFVPMPTAGGIDYGYTLASTFPSTTPSSFQTDDPDLDVTVTAMTDFYVWIRINGTAWNPSYTRNVRVYPDSPDINSVVMNMIIATGPAGTSAYSQIVQTSNRLYFNGATTDSVYNSKFAGKTYINELNFGTAPQLATVATSGAYADLTGKPALSTVATSGSYADLSNKPSGTAPISYNSGTNSFQITQASTSTNGFLSSTDWTTFNNKFSTPTGDTTQYVTGNGTLATFPVLASADKLVMVVRNTSGATITKGTVVYINGASGNKPTIGKALATSDATSAQTLGLVQSDIGNNSNGNVTLVGSITDIDTSAFTDGTQLYLSGTTAGAYTSTKTLAPTHLVYVGVVARAHPTQGVIEVKVQNGYELDEIHDVQISSPANKDILYRDSASSLWKHASIASVLGYTPYNATNPNNYIALTALSASAPLSYNNTTGAFTITQANTTTNGFLSSTDWNTFNSKQNALTLGNVSEVSSNVLMFPDGGTGKTIGNLSIQVIQASASTNGYLSSTDWTTFNNKQATITGGASTITTSNLTASRALISNASGKVDVSTVTSTELGYLSGVTSAIQTQLDAKQGTITNNITGTGTSGYLSKFTGTGTIGNSIIKESTGGIGINGTASTFSTNVYLDVIGNTTLQGGIIQSRNSDSTISGSFFVNANGLNVRAESNHALILGTNATEKLRITSAGNVGINGTPSAYSNYVYFDVIGNSTTQGGLIQSKSSDSSIQGSFFVNSNGLNIRTETTHSMLLSTNGTERMRITSAGNVGIGTTSPSASLEVSTGSDTYSRITGNRGNADAVPVGVLEFYNSNTSRLVGDVRGITGTGGTQSNSGQLAFYTNNAGSYAERMRITAAGNLLVNTTTDRATVIGGTGTGQTIGGSGTPNLAIWNTGNTDWVYSTAVGNDGTVYHYNRGNTPILFYTNATERMRVEAGGNILIGTTTDNGERLYVNGSIRATGNITANSDLVLKKNLKLVDNPIDKLNSLNGYLYQLKEDDSYQYGVVAQEVEKVLPHAVQTGITGIKGVAYNQLTPLLIEGFKVHETELQALKKRVAYLETKLG